MKNINIVIFLAISTVLLSACQSTRLNSDHSALASEPRLASNGIDLNKTYLWGGEILEVENLEKTTELTIISYPLDRNEKPKYTKQTTGRFIASYTGFLEPTDYQKGQLVTVVGILKKFKDGKVAKADYQFPVLDVTQTKLHNKANRGYRIPFSIGIGIGL